MSTKERVASTLSSREVFNNIISSLSVRATQVLERLGIRSILSLMYVSQEQLRSTWSCGNATVKEILELQRDIRCSIDDDQLSGMQILEESTVNTGICFEGLIGTLSVRARHTLECLGVYNIPSLLSLSRNTLLFSPGCGETTASEICRLQESLQSSYNRASPTQEKSCGSLLKAIIEFLGPRIENLLIENSIHTLEAFLNLELERVLMWQACDLNTAQKIIRTRSLMQTVINTLSETGDYSNVGCQSNKTMEENVSLVDSMKIATQESLTDSINIATWLIQWIQELAGSEGQARTFMICKGMLGSKPIPQAEAARQLGISRQRVSQLVKAIEEKINTPAEWQKLRPLLNRVKDFILSRGGIVSIDDLVKSVLGSGEDGDNLQYATELMILFLTSEDWRQEGLLLLPDGCVANSSLETKISNLSHLVCKGAEDFADERYSEELWSISRESLQSRTAKLISDEQNTIGEGKLSDSLFDTILRYCTGRLRQHDDRIYSSKLWRLKFGGLLFVVEEALNEIGSPAHYKEVAEKVRRWRGEFTNKQAHTTLSRCSKALLWDRGTFIHKDQVEPPLSLIHDVEQWLLHILDDDLPFVSVHGAFIHFEPRCISAGISSDIALYTCLRLSATSALVYPRIPCIYRKERFFERVPMTMELESYIQDAGGIIPLSDLKEFWIHRVFLKGYQLNMYLKRANNIIRTSEWGCVHLDNLDFDLDALHSLMEYTKLVLEKEKHCSIDKIYEDREVTCKAAGIDDPHMLYSIFQCFSEGALRLDCYPRVVAGNEELTSNLRTIRDRVRAFIREQNVPCTFETLETRFVEELGYKEQSVFSIVGQSDVVLYHPGCVILLEMLDWNDEKQRDLETTAQNYYSIAIAAGHRFGRVSSLVESDDIPKLPTGLHWSRTMLAEFLKKGGEFLLLGNTREVYIPKNSKSGITSFESLVGVLLNEEWGGGANIAKFEASLVDAGLVKKSLTRTMLGDGDLVTIRNGEIMLRELADA